MSDKTVFAKIIDRELPANIVYEDDRCLAFLDINPINKGHVLVIPKDHYVWLDEVPNDLLAHLFIIAKKIMRALKAEFNPYYVQLLVAGIDVPHVHIHVFPRFKDDNREHWHKTNYRDEAEKVAITEQIKAQLN